MLAAILTEISTVFAKAITKTMMDRRSTLILHIHQLLVSITALRPALDDGANSEALLSKLQSLFEPTKTNLMLVDAASLCEDTILWCPMIAEDVIR